jgi:plasmid stabilization system protein ParE
MAGQSKDVIASNNYEEHLVEILDQGIKTFGYFQARKYFHAILQFVEKLGFDYTVHPECRHLATKSRMYRNIILDSHLIIYRITDEHIEVLDIVHSASSIQKIRNIRSIRL